MRNIDFTPDNLDKAQLYLDVTGMAVVAVNRQGFITDTNNKVCDILGNDKWDIVYREFFSLFNLSESGVPNSQEIPEHCETIAKAKDGKRVILEWQAIPLRDKKDNLTGYLCLGNDITDIKRLTSELDSYNRRLEEVMLSRISELTKLNDQLRNEVRFRKLAEKRLNFNTAIMEKTTAVIFMMDDKGKIIYANDAACRIYGYSRPELFNINFRQLVHESELPQVNNMLKSVRENDISELETKHIRKDASTLPVRMRSVITDTPHGKFTVCEVIDISGP